MRYEFPVNPVAKPRMTQRDKWKRRPVVLKYFAFKDLLNIWAAKFKFKMPESGAHIKFFIPFPKTMPGKKAYELEGTKHDRRPDLDNFVKAVFDCLCVDDGYIWDIRATKYWSIEGKIIIET